MQLRAAVIWFSLLVLPVLALFEQPKSGSLGSWLWEDEGRAAPDTALLNQGTSAVRPVPAFEARQRAVQKASAHSDVPPTAPGSLRNAMVASTPTWGSSLREERDRDGAEIASREHDWTHRSPWAMSGEEIPWLHPESQPRHPSVAEDLESMTAKLRSNGAAYYVLECWEGPPLRYRFRCRMQPPGEDQGTTEFEAVAAGPLEAVRMVCLQVAQRGLLSQ